MRAIDKIEVEMSVVLGRTTMPINQLLRLGRGAVIMLDDCSEDLVDVEVNNSHFSKGEIIVKDETICIKIDKKSSEPQEA